MEKLNIVTNRLSQESCLILLFHGVIEKHESKIRNYTRKHVEASFFKNLLVELKKKGHPISMDDYFNFKIRNQPFPSNSFIITFDDGFENNFSVAMPILKELAIPSVFYVSTDFIENNSMSWIDKIEWMIEVYRPSFVDLPWEEDSRSLKTPEEIKNFLENIRKNIKNSPSILPEKFVKALAIQWGVTAPTSEKGPLDKKMSWSQVREISKDPLFIVGGHSHHHTNLAFLTPSEMRKEIDTSLELLKQNTETPPEHYCYPEGLENCFNPEIIEHLKERGIKASPTAIDGTNFLSTDLFHLKRVMVVD